MAGGGFPSPGRARDTSSRAGRSAHPRSPAVADVALVAVAVLVGVLVVVLLRALARL